MAISRETSIAVVGPGAIGSTVAALLHAAGHRVVVCGRTARESIELRPDGGDPIVVPGPVHTDPASIEGPVDVVILAVRNGVVARKAAEHGLASPISDLVVPLLAAASDGPG